MAQKINHIITIFLTAILTASLTVVTTIYIQYRTKPNLLLHYSYTMFMKFVINSDTPTAGLLLSDLYDHSIIPSGSIIFEGDGIKDFNFNTSSYSGTFLLENNGGGIAHDIQVGVGYKFDGVDFHFTTSPNAEIEILQKVKSENDIFAFPSFFQIKISTLAPGDVAVINFKWSLNSKNTDVFGEEPNTNLKIIEENKEIKYLLSKLFLPTILFFNSTEGRGKTNPISFFKIRNEWPEMIPFISTSFSMMISKGMYETRRFEWIDGYMVDEKTRIVIKPEGKTFQKNP